MVLIQITDVFNEPLDLWLSPNHEGQRRYVRKDDLLPEQTGELLGFTEQTGEDPRLTALVAQQNKSDREKQKKNSDEDGGGAGGGEGDGGVVLCSFIPEDDDTNKKSGNATAIVPWLQPGAAAAGAPSSSGVGGGGAATTTGAAATAESENDATAVRVPVPPPAGLITTLKPIPSVLPHPDKKNPVGSRRPNKWNISLRCLTRGF